VDEGPKPLEERPFVGELGDALRAAVEQVRGEPPPAASLGRALGRARRLGPGKVNPWLRYHRIAVAAAVVAVLLLSFGLLLVCWRPEPKAPPRVFADAFPGHGDDPGDIDVSVGDPSGRPRPGAGHGRRGENPFVEAEHGPVSTFPLTVDPAAYRDVRRALLEQKRLPAANVVRVADLVNSFSYSYPEPSGDDPVSLTLDLAECPWEPAHALARIGLRSRSDAAARDVRVEAVFNPRRVASYRLIGWEGRAAAFDEQSVAAGQAVTALYEIVPTKDADKEEWLTVKIRSGGRAVERSLGGEARRFAEAPEDFRFAAAAAEFGLLLRDSAYKGRASYAAVRAAARGALGADVDGRRAEFLALVDAAERLTRTAGSRGETPGLCNLSPTSADPAALARACTAVAPARTPSRRAPGTRRG
jgi:von Willebrand factor/Uncharacterized protein YfbK, C-terminal